MPSCGAKLLPRQQLRIRFKLVQLVFQRLWWTVPWTTATHTTADLRMAKFASIFFVLKTWFNILGQVSNYKHFAMAVVFQEWPTMAQPISSELHDCQLPNYEYLWISHIFTFVAVGTTSCQKRKTNKFPLWWNKCVQNWSAERPTQTRCAYLKLLLSI